MLATYLEAIRCRLTNIAVLIVCDNKQVLYKKEGMNQVYYAYIGFKRPMKSAKKK